MHWMARVPRLQRRGGNGGLRAPFTGSSSKRAALRTRTMTPSSLPILDEFSPAPVGDFAGPGLDGMLAGMDLCSITTQLQQGYLVSNCDFSATLNGFHVDAARERCVAVLDPDWVIPLDRLHNPLRMVRR